MTPRSSPKLGCPRRARPRRVHSALWALVAAGVWLTLQLRFSNKVLGGDMANNVPFGASREGPSARSAGRRLTASDRADGPVDLKFDMLHWIQYAVADVRLHGITLNGTCDEHYGAAFLQKFADSRRVLCSAEGSTSSSSGAPGPSSHVACHAYPYRNFGLACKSRNLVLNATAFMGVPTPPGEKEHYRYLPGGIPGSVKLDCQLPHIPKHLEAAAWSLGFKGAALNSSLPPGLDNFTANLARERTPWFTSAAARAAPGDIDAACRAPSGGGGGGGAVQHPVMLVSRLDPTNPFIHSQSVVQAFLTLAALQAANGGRAYSALQVMGIIFAIVATSSLTRIIIVVVIITAFVIIASSSSSSSSS